MKFLSKKNLYGSIILTALFIQIAQKTHAMGIQNPDWQRIDGEDSSYTPIPTPIPGVIQFGGIQLITLLSGTCNASVPDPTMGVHIILNTATPIPSFISLAYTHTAILYGGMNVDLSLYQMGTYIPTPIPCMANTPLGPVLIWPTVGFYSMVATSEATLSQKRLFAQEMVPFFNGIDKNS